MGVAYKCDRCGCLFDPSRHEETLYLCVATGWITKGKNFSDRLKTGCSKQINDFTFCSKCTETFCNPQKEESNSNENDSSNYDNHFVPDDFNDLLLMLCGKSGRGDNAKSDDPVRKSKTP